MTQCIEQITLQLWDHGNMAQNGIRFYLRIIYFNKLSKLTSFFTP